MLADLFVDPSTITLPGNRRQITRINIHEDSDAPPPPPPKKPTWQPIKQNYSTVPFPPIPPRRKPEREIVVPQPIKLPPKQDTPPVVHKDATPKRVTKPKPAQNSWQVMVGPTPLRQVHKYNRLKELPLSEHPRAIESRNRRDRRGAALRVREREYYRAWMAKRKAVTAFMIMMAANARGITLPKVVRTRGGYIFKQVI